MKTVRGLFGFGGEGRGFLFFCGFGSGLGFAGEKKKISNGTGDCGCCPLLPGPEKWLKSACLPKPRMRRNRGFSREESQQGKEVGWGLSSSFLAEREGLNNGLGPGATASFGDDIGLERVFTREWLYWSGEDLSSDGLRSENPPLQSVCIGVWEVPKLAGVTSLGFSIKLPT
ncbi:hypothetical protein NC652_005648 [Populus alba x Populus x berolinensis]|nr:hypothetical protein NC652_005648 [Populus alba x Populus x berolinensis]